jgi:hypothetical protein
VQVHAEHQAGADSLRTRNRYWLPLTAQPPAVASTQQRTVAPTGQDCCTDAALTTSRELDPVELHLAPATSLQPQERTKRRDDLFEAVCEVCAIDWSKLTASGRGPLNRAVAELRGVGATPADVLERAANYRLHYEATLTPMALAKHWAQIGQPPAARGRRAAGDAALAEVIAATDPAGHNIRRSDVIDVEER